MGSRRERDGALQLEIDGLCRRLLHVDVRDEFAGRADTSPAPSSSRRKRRESSLVSTGCVPFLTIDRRGAVSSGAAHPVVMHQNSARKVATRIAPHWHDPWEQKMRLVMEQALV